MDESGRPSTFSPAVVLPTYNNAGTLLDILRRVEALGLPMFIINDGSTDRTAAILDAWRPAARCAATLRHPVNRGKAAALATGFQAASAAGHTHAITIDTDGQLDPEQIPALLETARANPDALVLGVRDDSRGDYPGRSRVGRRVSNFFVRLESGLRVGDSQCGLRVYPLELILRLRCRAHRFGYETEVLTRAAWAGGRAVEVPVNCRYLPPGQRVSHFRPWLDSFRAVRMHLRLLGRALWPWPHRRLVAQPAQPGDGRPWYKRAWDWVSPVQLWRQLRQDDVGRLDLATGLSVGVFIANLPIYGAQTLLSLYVARRLHLHPLPVVAGAHISTPPMNVVMVLAGICLGHLLLHGSWPVLANYNPARLGWGKAAGSVMLDWTVGGVVLGLAMGAVTFLVCQVIFRFFPPRRPAE